MFEILGLRIGLRIYKGGGVDNDLLMYVELGVGLLEMELQFGYLILGVGVARAVLCKRYVTQWRGGSLSNTYGADWRLGDITIHHMV